MPHNTIARLPILFLATLSMILLAPPHADAAPVPAVMSAGDLGQAVHQLAAQHNGVVSAESLAKSGAGRDVWLLTLAASGQTPPDQRQAILIVGGIDADHPAAAQIAFELCKELLAEAAADAGSDAAKLLKTRTLYVIPRANPDGVETCLEPVQRGDRVNARPVDDDRDGVVNEDGPNDLDGDGVIAIMRIRDPEGPWMVDPDDERLMKKADPAKGEHGGYRLMLEGKDDDADGQTNEDGPGGVDDDRNWPHFYQPGHPETGLHQISEPENRAIAEFVVDHPHITAAIVFGRHDNIVKVPKGKQRGPDGQSYRDLHPDDVPIYEHISQLFKETTGLQGSAGSDPSGALYAWLYSQRGITTFAVNPWWPIDKEEKEADSQPASKPASDQRKGAETDKPQDQAKPPAGGRPGRMFGRPSSTSKGGGDEAGGAPWLKRVVSSDMLKKWLKYSDEKRDGAGFVAWHSVDQPEFGQVELGGLRPYFMTSPTPDELKTAAESQAHFLTKLSALLPRPHLAATKVETAGADVWEVELSLSNDAYLPTHTAIARQTQQPPFAVRPKLPPERIIGGQRLQRVDNLPGSGGVAKLKWLIRGQAGQTVTFRAYNRAYGELLVDVKLENTAAGKEGR